jgi:alcohol dehydrogenase class IV
MGGGSVIDSGKAVSALLTNHGDILDYLEVVGAGKSIENPAAKMIAVPTTAGTGSEVTKNAVILVEEQHVKVSLRSELMIPRVALIDPMLSLSLPPQYTASTGMDALTQVVEPFVSNKANQMTDLFCESGIKSARNALLEAYQNGDNLSAREKMSWTSLMGGLALANAGLGAVHGFAAVIGGMFDAPHGDICARLLPIVFEVNCREIQKTSECTKYLSRFIQISRWLVGRDNAGIEDGVYFLSNLAEKLNIPSLSIYGLDSSRIEEIAQKARNASSMKGNPVRLNDDVLIEIMQRAISD